MPRILNAVVNQSLLRFLSVQLTAEMTIIMVEVMDVVINIGRHDNQP